jgi:hypothetical protein
MLTREEVSTLAETVHNGDLIDWVHWAQYPNITPTQAARLANHIDPIKWLKDYSEGKLPDDLRQEIDRLEQWLDGHSQLWTLADLVTALGDDVAPFGMVQAVKAKQQAEALGESHINTLTKLVTESPKRLDSCWIAELWAAIPNKVYEQEKPFWLIRDNFNKLMELAIINDELEATTEERAVGIDDGFKEITEKNRIRKIKNGWLGNNFVNFIITRDDLRKWLISFNQWPLADGCLLAKWFEPELQTEAVGDAGTVKPRKKLKPLERETNEGLLLIYEIFNYYKVEYLDELPAQKAWGKIISKEFNSDLLSSIAGSNKSITLSGGEKISKTDFSDKYRRRFE